MLVRVEDAVTVSTPFDEAVQAAVDRLSFEYVEAMWLVDVCDCSYDVAAANAGVTRSLMIDRLHRARRQVSSVVRRVEPSLAPAAIRRFPWATREDGARRSMLGYRRS